MSATFEEIQRKLDRIFAEKGMLARGYPGYVARPAQLEMAQAVLEALGLGRTALLEAGTGTGKTLAYLIPAALSGKRVVISTHTKALQDQLMEKDIPLARRAVETPFTASRLKGRNNYVCRRRMDEFDASPVFDTRQEATLYKKFRKWTDASPTGDRDEFGELPDGVGFWRHVGSTTETCLGRKCPYYRESFTTVARANAAEADIVVVNHHLFFADLALRQRGKGELLPDYDAVIFDEAHHLEEVCGQFFGAQVSNWRVQEFLRDTRHELQEAAPQLREELLPTLDALDQAQAEFFDGFQGGPNRFALKEAGWHEVHAQPYAQMVQEIGRVGRRLESVTGGGETVAALVERSDLLTADLATIADFADAQRVRWGERRGRRGLFLHATPIDVSAIFRDLLRPRLNGLVLTSATLTTGGSFQFILSRLGLEESLPIERSWPSVFDFARQTLLYFPDDLPEPTSPEFRAAAIERIAQLIEISQGRALVLFTNLSMMEAASRALVGRFSFPIYTQGEGSRIELLERFRKETHSVLLASSSFREGIDVVGESLSLTILDKMPFASPGDPLEEARIEHLKRQGQSPFAVYSLPAALLAFRQAFGRLIRSNDDRGVFAMLDRRIWSRSYGRVFRQAAPTATVTRNLADAATFFGRPPTSRPASQLDAGAGQA